MIIIGEDRLRRTLLDYLDHYHNSRPHWSLERNSPNPREVEASAKGKIIAQNRPDFLLATRGR
jgi:hypothetical protein